MNFLRNRHKLARILLGNFAFAFATLCLSPATLFAHEKIRPVVLPEIELVTPVQLIDGVVSEVVVPGPETKIAASKSSAKMEISHLKRLQGEALVQASCHTATTLDSIPGQNCQSLSESANSSLLGKNQICAKGSDLKSIANLGLLAFFEICLSQSELPSRNLSMPCANSPSKSMIPKSANDSRSLWRQAKTTFLWHRSISSLQIPRILIPEALLNHLHNMSDISSIWLSGMAVFPPISVEMKEMAVPAPLVIVATAKS